MDNIVLTYFHHGENIIADPNLNFKGEIDAFDVFIGKDHYSLVEFLSYSKDLGYSNIMRFY